MAYVSYDLLYENGSIIPMGNKEPHSILAVIIYKEAVFLLSLLFVDLPIPEYHWSSFNCLLTYHTREILTRPPYYFSSTFPALVLNTGPSILLEYSHHQISLSSSSSPSTPSTIITIMRVSCFAFAILPLLSCVNGLDNDPAKQASEAEKKAMFEIWRSIVAFPKEDLNHLMKQVTQNLDKGVSLSNPEEWSSVGQSGQVHLMILAAGDGKEVAHLTKRLVSAVAMQVRDEPENQIESEYVFKDDSDSHRTFIVKYTRRTAGNHKRTMRIERNE